MHELNESFAAARDEHRTLSTIVKPQELFETLDEHGFPKMSDRCSRFAAPRSEDQEVSFAASKHIFAFEASTLKNPGKK